MFGLSRPRPKLDKNSDGGRLAPGGDRTPDNSFGMARAYTRFARCSEWPPPALTSLQPRDRLCCRDDPSQPLRGLRRSLGERGGPLFPSRTLGVRGPSQPPTSIGYEARSLDASRGQLKGDQRDALGDVRPVPQVPVLFRQRDQLAVGIGAGRATGEETDDLAGGVLSVSGCGVRTCRCPGDPVGLGGASACAVMSRRSRAVVLWCYRPTGGTMRLREGNDDSRER